MLYHMIDNSYIGLVYYEWKEREYLMTFVAGKKLTKLIQVKNLILTIFLQGFLIAYSKAS